MKCVIFLILCDYSHITQNLTFCLQLAKEKQYIGIWKYIEKIIKDLRNSLINKIERLICEYHIKNILSRIKYERIR